MNIKELQERLLADIEIVEHETAVNDEDKKELEEEREAVRKLSLYIRDEIEL